MSMAPVRIIGGGLIGSRLGRLMAAEDRCELVAVADPAPAGVDLAAELGVAWFADYEEMLGAVAPDGVVVATPNQMHLPAAVACAAHGAHILMEKPIAHSVAAGRELVGVVRGAGVGMTVGQHRRFDPAAEAAKQIIDGGEIGDLLAVSATWAVRKPTSYFDTAWRREKGGGVVLINLIHDMDMLRHLCGEIATVHGELGHGARGFEVEDTAALVIRFKSGALATVMISDAAPSPWGWEMATGENPGIPATGQNCYRFMGTRGSLDFPNIELWRHGEGDAGDWSHAIHGSRRRLPPRAALADQLKHFLRLVRGEEPPRISGEDGLASLAATEAVLRSHQTGGPVAPEFTL
jgi:predicted dehydrogenase